MTGNVNKAGRLPAGAYAAALASLPCVGPAWLVDVLEGHPPAEAWELVAAGVLVPSARTRLEPRGPTWADVARRLDVAALWARCQEGGIAVSWPGRPDYPAALLRGPSPAGVLFSVGRPGTLADRGCVAIVGTRRCTPEGAAVAYQLGYDLSCAGVVVVSGLALGIDGAAHAGALASARDMGSRFSGPAAPVSLAPVSPAAVSLAPVSPTPVSRAPVSLPLSGGPGGGASVGSTVGVAASGVDVIYPRQHGALWREVARLGAIVSETPPGVQAKAWRFPARNRLIAGLAQMVVVVECHASGGSWHTVDAALRQGLEVGAVPGSVHSSASVGTNTLIHEGATPVRDAQDVLDALGMFETKNLPRPLEGSDAWRQGPAGQARGGRAHSADGPDGQASPSGLSGPGARAIGPGSPDGYGGDRAARRSNPQGSLAGAPGPRQRGNGPRTSPAAGWPARRERGARAGAVDDGPFSTLDERVRASLNWRPLCLEEIVERSGLPAAAVVVSLDRLEEQGLVSGDGGWWVVAKR